MFVIIWPFTNLEFGKNLNTGVHFKLFKKKFLMSNRIN